MTGDCVDSGAELSSFSERRRPRPPRRRRRRRFSLSVATSSESRTDASLLAGFWALRAFGAAATTGAAWNIGAGITPALFVFFSLAGVSFAAESEVLVALFLTARLRTFFGSSAIRSNPLV